MLAMTCDALDAAKYNRFAARARMDDDWKLAIAFEDAADSDRTEHFAKEAEVKGLIASSPTNLRNVLTSEKKEIEMFARFAREASDDGDAEIAAVFENIRDDKTKQYARFEAVLADMGVHSNVEIVR
jgi:rubrerythrin